MNIFDSIARRWGGSVVRPPEQPATDREKVFANPKGYTRHARRSVGYTRPVWAEVMRAVRSSTPFVPRYLRRHSTALFTTPTTRRQRRAKARCVRAVARLGATLA